MAVEQKSLLSDDAVKPAAKRKKPLKTGPAATPSTHLLERGDVPIGIENVPPVFYLSPNPYMGDLVDQTTLPKAVHEPYGEGISAGKNTYVYDAHTYHTKVPPQGIELLVDYYTEPDQVVLDPFCGSGMTGVAALQKGRKAILSDLSPAATFIAYNLATPIDEARYMAAVTDVLALAQGLEAQLYNTNCRACGTSVPMLYMVWSYGMVCSHCEQEFVLWDVARDERPRIRDSKIKKEFNCPHCDGHLEKRKLKRTRRYPVSVGYRCCQRGLQEQTAAPSAQDLSTLEDIDRQGVPPELWYPTDAFPAGMNTKQPIDAGFATLDRAYTTRALWAMAFLWDVANRWPEPDVRQKLLFTVTSLYQRVTLFSEFRFWGGSSNTANYNVPTIINEQNVFRTFERKAKTIRLYFASVTTSDRSANLRVSCQSACHLPQLPDRSIDYIFTDPPFGANINYSEMNFLWESWLQRHTDNTEEAIVNKVQKKSVEDYGALLAEAFTEMRRVLKDGGWLTIIFHNSSAQVWRALQRAVSQAGFGVEGTQIFDKEHGTFKQFVSDNAVGYDLVLHCRKADVPAGAGAVPEAAAGEVERHAASFIRELIAADPNGYTVHYLHVDREWERDYRRLYVEWLATALPLFPISINFDAFRRIVDDTLRTQAAE